MNLTFSAIQHVGLPVTNLETREAFYKSFGFENVMAAEFIHKGDKGRGGHVEEWRYYY